METTHEATRAERRWQVALFMQKPMGTFKVSANVESGD
jgi:hypothetical protein